MTPADAAELLAIAAAFDRRKIGKADAIAWADALSGLEVADCAEAVRAHFRESTDYLMPVHVRQGVRKIRAERIRTASSALLEPVDVDPNDVRAYLEAGRRRRRAIAAGEPVAAESEHPKRDVAALVAETAGKLPRIPPAVSA